MDLRDHDVADALIVGAGPAGLSAALALARLHHTATVFDSGTYRNDASERIHLVLGWDGKRAAEFRASARQNILDQYDTVAFRDVGVEALRRRSADGLFEAVDAQGRTHVGRKVILATGARDVFPPIEGFAECWAKGVYHCLICSLATSKQSSAGVLVHGEKSEAQHLLILARMALQHAASVTIYTNAHAAIHRALQSTLGHATDRPTARQAPPPIQLDARPVARLAMASSPSASPSPPSFPSSVVLTFADGSSAVEGFVAHRTQTAPRTRLASMLGVELVDSGEAIVGWKARQTSVRGVFAAGDAANLMKNVPLAQLDGTYAAWGLAMQLEADLLGHGDIDFADR